MKVGVLYQTPDPRLEDSQAAQVHISQVVAALEGLGHCVRVLTLQGRYPVYTDNLQAARDEGQPLKRARLSLSGTKAFLGCESGVRRIQRHLHFPYLGIFDSLHFAEGCRHELADYDVIHERYNTLARGGAWAARTARKPLIVEVNGDMIAERQYQGRPLRGVQRWIAVSSMAATLAAASAVVCPSHGLADHMAKAWQFPTAKLFVVPNAADVDAFGAQGRSAAWRDRLGLSAGDLVGVYVGGFYSWHALDVVIEAFAHVRARIPNARLILVGDGRVRSQIEAQVAAGGLSAEVLLPGAVPHAEVPGLLAEADVALASFREKGWGIAPLKLFEYMAAGKAIVASRVGEIDRFIRDEETGVLVEPDSADAMATAMLRLFLDERERVRLGSNARREAVEKYSWKAHAERLVDIYRTVLCGMTTS